MKNIWFISLCAVILFHACIDDDSTLPVKSISEISIHAPSDTINLDFGFFVDKNEPSVNWKRIVF